MAKKTAIKAGDVVNLGPLEFESAMLKTLAALDTAKTGVILANERIPNLLVNHGDDVHPRWVSYTLSVYIQREALTEQEQTDVDATAAERNDAKAKRDADEQAKREREVKRAMELGIEAANSAARFDRDARAAGYVPVRS